MNVRNLMSSGVAVFSAFAICSCETYAPAVQNEVPSFYVKQADALVQRSLSELSKGKEPDYFWLAWGATSAQSSRRDDPKLKAVAVAAIEKMSLDMEAKPQAYWGLIPALQSVKFADDAKLVPSGTVDLWLKRLRPSVVACYDSQNGSEWITIAPNTLHQAAAGLALAVTVYGSRNPDEPDLGKWMAQAKACVAKADKMQLPGGAFSYIRNSGPDPVYYNFDATFLGVYYLNSKDSLAKKEIGRMSGWSKSAAVGGCLTAFSSPWWKHCWGSGGPYFGPEIIASVSGDPLTAAVMRKRRDTTGQPFYFSYYSMEFFKAASKEQPISDRCEFDLNANGPAFRDGSFDVEMPFRPWCDSTCGASVSSANGISSYVNSVGLLAVEDDAKGFPGVYGVVADDEFSKGVSLNGDGWIAHAVSFRAVHGAYGDISKAPSPWQRTDIWFADKNGFAGAVELKAIEEAKGESVSAWVYVSKNFEVQRQGLKSPDIALEFEGLNGTLALPAKDDKGHNLAKALVATPVKGVFAKGSTWTLKASAQRSGSGHLSLGSCKVENGIHSVEILLDGKRRCVLSFDPDKQKLKSDISVDSTTQVSAKGIVD